MSSISPQWLSLDDALHQALALTPVVSDAETILITDALLRITAEDIIAPVDVPPWDNSAMDGYALKVEDANKGDTLTISQTLFAGDSGSKPLKEGSAVRIMTGAPIPPEANCVVMQENVEATPPSITLLTLPSKGDNIRRKGCDIAAGDCIISKGTRLSAAHLMLLASLGLDTVRVLQKVKVGLMATGSELCAPGKPLASGQIYESNSTGISALLKSIDVAITHYGIVKDDVDTLTQTISRAAEEVDILITSGGVSVGDADHVKPVIESIGNVNFWKVAIKPGKPFAFGRVGNMVFCGVPGNPVSAYVTTQMLVMPVVERMQGVLSATSPLRLKARLTTSIIRKPGRTDFQRGRFWQEKGQWLVSPLPKQSSGVMSSVTQANCYLELPAPESEFIQDQWVTIIPFSCRITSEGT